MRVCLLALLAACAAPNTVTLIGPAGDSRKDYYRDARLVGDGAGGVAVRLLGAAGGELGNPLGGLPSDRAFVDIPVAEPFATGTYRLADQKRAVRAGSIGVAANNYMDFPEGEVVVESIDGGVMKGRFAASRGMLSIGGNFKVELHYTFRNRTVPTSR